MSPGCEARWQAAMQREPAAPIPQAEFSAMLQRWVQMNWVRQGIGLLAFGSVLHALGLAYEARRGPGEYRPPQGCALA
jgi:hypothetical protein